MTAKLAFPMAVVLAAACAGIDDASTASASWALVGGDLSSINGSYGAGCVARSGAWTVLVDPAATPDHDPLSVVAGNGACTLTVTSVRTGPTAGELYLLTSPIALSDAYQPAASPCAAEGQPVAFYANARLDAIGFAGDFELTLVTSADPGLTSSTRTALRTYSAEVMNDAPLSYWRLGESPPPGTAADSAGSNDGTFFDWVDLGIAGALIGDADTAGYFGGAWDHVQVARQVSDDFAIEVWFASTQGIGTGSHWWSGAGLVDGDVSGPANDFGVSLRADGHVVAGVGSPEVSVVSTTSGLNDGQWHHVVFTRVRATGALKLYVDGQPEGTATGPTVALNSATTLSFGVLQNSSNYFVGSLDEIAIYTTALTPERILRHYQASGQP